MRVLCAVLLMFSECELRAFETGFSKIFRRSNYFRFNLRVDFGYVRGFTLIFAPESRVKQEEYHCEHY